MKSIALPQVTGRPWWRVAQRAGVVLTVGLLAGLVLWPKTSLHILWDMVVPLLPAVFLVNPLIWRNVCPLATLNTATGTRREPRAIGSAEVRVAWAVGIVLLFVLVAARRFLFNTNGVALAVTVAVVSLLAVASGFVYSRRAGFCNGLCPVLPVEKLYGQSPLVAIGDARCTTCTMCTPAACIDLAGNKAIAQTIGPHRRDASWLLTSYGIFAAAFPGFVIGYFTTENGDLSSALRTYGHIALWALGSWVVTAGLVAALRIRATTAIATLGVTALALYYWFAAPSLVIAYGGAAGGAVIVRVAAAALIAAWLVRRGRNLRRDPSLRSG